MDVYVMLWIGWGKCDVCRYRAPPLLLPRGVPVPVLPLALQRRLQPRQLRRVGVVVRAFLRQQQVKQADEYERLLLWIVLSWVGGLDVGMDVSVEGGGRERERW